MLYMLNVCSPRANSKCNWVFINHCLFQLRIPFRCQFQFRSISRSRVPARTRARSHSPLVVFHIVGLLLVAAIQWFSF